MIIKTWNIEEMTGYKPISTFYEDFSIADKFGINAVKETAERCFKEWKSDYKMLTELVMVFSWKSFEHAENEKLCELYSDLYYKYDAWALKHLKGEEKTYYIRTTD